MLVLTRKSREKLYVGDNIVVTVLSVQGGRVRLGFEAPPEVPVHRQEVLQRLRAEQDAKEESASEAVASQSAKS